MKLWLLGLVLAACGDSHGAADAGCTTDCTTPPASTCSGEMATTWSTTGTCVEGQCVYASTTTPCLESGWSHCAGEVCITAPYVCENPCANITSCNGAMLETNHGFCTSYAGACEHTNAVGTDCSTMMTPPPPGCAGTVAITYSATGTCIESGASAACGYAQTSVDCATTNQVCMDGSCVAP